MGEEMRRAVTGNEDEEREKGMGQRSVRDGQRRRIRKRRSEGEEEKVRERSIKEENEKDLGSGRKGGTAKFQGQKVI